MIEVCIDLIVMYLITPALKERRCKITMKFHDGGIGEFMAWHSEDSFGYFARDIISHGIVFYRNLDRIEYKRVDEVLLKWE
jgi:hypothetical protein